MEKEPAEGGASLAIVGIGASAGGLNPLGEFFDAMPADSGLVFVFVQHLSPHSPSILPDLLGRHTAMEVRHAEDGVRVAPNVVYVIPPGYDLVLNGAVLHLQPRDGPEEPHLPIDLFFRSLAEDRGEAAIGIILSGAGADGALGLRAVKERGGLAIVQSPETAEQASVPRNALEAGLVDYIQAPGDMPPSLLTYAAYLREERLAPSRFRTDTVPAAKRLLAIVAARTGHDFGLYKQGTVLRRIERRMLLRQIDDLDEYAGLYDGAPVGYFTVGDDGTIVRAHATAAALLGAGPNALAGRPFYSLIAREDQDAYHFFLLRLLLSDGLETVELFLVRANGTRLRARIEGVTSSAGQQGSNR